MQFGSMLVYCTVYDMCVWGGPTSIFFQGAPNPLATALHVYIDFTIYILKIHFKCYLWNLRLFILFKYINIYPLNAFIMLQTAL